VVSVQITDGTKDVLISTATGMSNRFPEGDVRSMGRGAYGVKGITLDEGDEVVSAELVEKATTILTVTENGYGKRTQEDEYRVQGRGGKGIIDIKTTDRNGTVVGAVQVRDEDEVMLVTNGGMLIRMKVKDISVIGRNTQGVRLISLESQQEQVVAVSRLPEIAGEGEIPPDDVTELPEEGGSGTPPAEASGEGGAESGTDGGDSGGDGDGDGDGEPPAE
jgi:DNA gyrase subunit A